MPGVLLAVRAVMRLSGLVTSLEDLLADHPDGPSGARRTPEDYWFGRRDRSSPRPRPLVPAPTIRSSPLAQPPVAFASPPLRAGHKV
jgi:hypothetical protein